MKASALGRVPLHIVPSLPPHAAVPSARLTSYRAPVVNCSIGGSLRRARLHIGCRSVAFRCFDEALRSLLTRAGGLVARASYVVRVDYIIMPA